MFVRGGFINPGRSLANTGNEGYNLSSVGYGPPNAYFLYFSSENIDASEYKDRYYGQSLRCVALGEVLLK